MPFSEYGSIPTISLKMPEEDKGALVQEDIAMHDV